MSELKDMGVKITLDREREMVFNLNVLDACIEKYGKMDDVLNGTAKDLEASIWLAIQMLNEGAEIYNENNPENKVPLITEKILKRYVIGLGNISAFTKKVQEALLKGLPKDAVEEVEELGKNLMAAQSGKANGTRNGTVANRAQRRAANRK